MRDTELYFAQKFCWDHKIFVVVKVVINGSNYRLAISRNGKEVIGDRIYENKAVINQLEEELPSGKIKIHRIIIPSVHTRIKELYIEIFRENTTKLKPEISLETA